MRSSSSIAASLTATVAAVITASAAAQSMVRPDYLIRASDPQPYDGFGYGLAVEGASMLVGSRGSDSTALNGGAVYAFTATSSSSGSAWQQVQKLVFPGAQAGDGIGESLALRGAVGVAGAPGRGAGGSAFILRFDGGAWFPVVEVSDAGAGAAAEFGASTSCDADRVVIGAPASVESVGAFAGRVRVFRRNSTTWNSAEAITAPFPDPGDRFGFAVAIEDAWLAVAAPGDDDAGVNAGAVYLYRESGGAFTLFAKLMPPHSATMNAESGFGQSLALVGGELLVGAPRADLAGSDAGAVYRFTLTAKGATPAGTVLPPPGTGVSEFGFSVARLANTTLVGAPGLVRDGALVGGAFIYLGGSSPAGVLSPAGSSVMTLAGTRVALTTNSMIASAPAMQALSASYAGQMLAIDRTLDCNESGVPDAIEIANGVLVDGNDDGVPDACQCLPDLSGDNLVSAADLALLLGFWGTSGAGVIDADINDDGIVNAADLSILLGAWGPCAN